MHYYSNDVGSKVKRAVREVDTHPTARLHRSVAAAFPIRLSPKAM